MSLARGAHPVRQLVAFAFGAIQIAVCLLVVGEDFSLGVPMEFAAELEGQLTFEAGYVLDVWELLDLPTRTIRSYSYELNCAGERIWWYDPTEHPGDKTLSSSYPHHKHLPPDIKHHRIPAPELSFARPNLPVLIEEVERLVKG